MKQFFIFIFCIGVIHVRVASDNAPFCAISRVPKSTMRLASMALTSFSICAPQEVALVSITLLSPVITTMHGEWRSVSPCLEKELPKELPPFSKCFCTMLVTPEEAMTIEKFQYHAKV